MNAVVEGLINKVGNKPLVIWGARMTGIGFLRFAKKYELNPIGFVDSDTSLTGRNISGLPIGLPKEILSLKKQHQDLIIVVAVSIKEDEIISSLAKMGVSGAEIVNYHDLTKTFFTIDIVGSCNLKCPSCPQSMTGLAPKGFMSLETYKKVTDKILKEVDIASHVSLYSWGEPFLHSELPGIIEHTHSLGIATAVSTNLSIVSTKQIKAIMKTGPDYLKISISGFYPEAYDSTHTGGNINLVKSNLYRLRYLIDKYNVSVFVEVNYHLYTNNIGEDLIQIKKLCKDLDFALSPCYSLVAPVERVVDYCEGRIDEETKQLTNLLLVSIDKGLEIAKPYSHLPCRFLTNQLNINWDLSVPLCCVVFDRQTSSIVDNFLETPLKKINEKKIGHPQCTKCFEHNIPHYQLGVNQPEWAKEADRVIKERHLNDSGLRLSMDRL